MTTIVHGATPRRRVGPQRKTAASRSTAGRERRARRALYRLMTWLSPSFPVGAFSYSSGIEWAVEAGDINDAATFRDWLAAMLADGPGFCDGVFLAPCAARRVVTRRCRIARGRGACRRLRAIARAAARNHGAGPRVHRHRARRLELRRRWSSCSRDLATAPSPIPSRSAWSARGHGIPLDADVARVPARADRRTGSPPAPGSFRSGRPTASASWPRWSRSWSQPQGERWMRRSTISAARRSAPISRACSTRPSIRGCSGHEQRRMRPRTVAS